MRRDAPPHDEAPPLFDLPMGVGERPAPDPGGPETEATDANLELFETGEGEAPDTAAEPDTQVFTPAQGSTAPTLGQRVVAGLFDLGVAFAVLTIALVGTVLMAVSVRLSYWPAMVLFLGAFSFIYYALPLAFWGRTPGMAWAGLVARNDGDRPLTFGQTALRWIAAVITTVLLGVPILITIRGLSLADRISGSKTFSRPG